MKPDLHRDAKARAYERVWIWLRFGDAEAAEAALRQRVAHDRLEELWSAGKFWDPEAYDNPR